MSEAFAQPHRMHSRRVFFLVLIHLTFALIGTATTLLGVILPALANRFQLDDARSGNFFVAQFAGSLIGTFLAEQIWLRQGFVRTIAVGLLAMSAGVCGISFFDLNGVFAGIFLNGLGIGLAIPATNLLISVLSEKRAASALNVLNFVWSGGAMVCPAFVGLLGNSFDIRLPLAALAAALLLLTFAVAVFSRVQSVSVFGARQTTSLPFQNVWQARFAVIIAASLFLGVGAENSLSGWLTAYSLRLQDIQGSLWTAIATVFWTAFLLGRLLAPLFLRKITEKQFILFSLIIGAGGAGLLLIPSHFVFVSTGTFLAGFGLAPVFPTLLAQFTRCFGETGATKWLFVSGTLGGAFLTWLVGFLSSVSGSLRSGLATTLGCFLLMIVLQLLLIADNRARGTIQANS